MRKIVCGICLLASLLIIFPASAIDFTIGASLSSGNFRVLDPQHSSFGAVSSASSSSFRLVGALGDIAVGSSSATTFGLRSGFLYYTPLTVAPVLQSASVTGVGVNLQWSAVQLSSGLIFGSYSVCTKPAGGSYTCEAAGSALAFTKTGLTPGTTYTFQNGKIQQINFSVFIYVSRRGAKRQRFNNADKNALRPD